MSVVLAYLREFNFVSALFRLLLSLAVGGVIGFGRSRKQRSAGLRTYMLTCVGAALTVIIAFYERDMLYGVWSAMSSAELKFDGTRLAAGVISGIGFLAAGTIIGVEHQQVSGLTTAIGLFGAACLGLACGAGFYEAVLPAAVLIIVAMETLQPVEIAYKRRLRNITIFVEFDELQDIETIRKAITAERAQIFEMDLERAARTEDGYPAAILSVKLGKGAASHSAMLSSIAELPCVHAVRELIS
ncbi:MAG: MgtC/SapB family protein [Oscillospiraceae bacterium]|nr:MgtC/SapB family protein [Oscillospiraceae bacterium]MBQ9719590.1 MgtC/SapB family protein [Oscillospiraceae bacterium]